MQQPPGYEQGNANVVCKLKRSLYGLKQAPRACYNKLKSELETYGFRASTVDAGLYVMGWKQDTVYLVVWVDDILIAAKHSETIDMVKHKLKSAFDIHDLGEAKRFLGMDITRDRTAGTLQLSQSRAVTDLLEKFNMSECKGCIIPISVGTALTADGEKLDLAKFPYSASVGSMMYLSVCTRPDISFAVGALSRFMSTPTVDHWRIAKGVLRYLSATVNTCFTFSKAKAGL
jgi:hypothetical protein